jgi:hypothetical protein
VGSTDRIQESEFRSQKAEGERRGESAVGRKGERPFGFDLKIGVNHRLGIRVDCDLGYYVVASSLRYGFDDSAPRRE